MKRAALYSAILHGIILLLFVVGLYNPFERKLADQRPLIIDFVNISDKSVAPVLAPEAQDEPSAPEEKPEEPESKPEPKPDPTP